MESTQSIKCLGVQKFYSETMTPATNITKTVCNIIFVPNTSNHSSIVNHIILHTVFIMFVDIKKRVRNVVERIDKPGVFIADVLIEISLNGAKT